MASEREREKEDEGPEPPWVARGVIEARMSLSSVLPGGEIQSCRKEHGYQAAGHQNQPGRSPPSCCARRCRGPASDDLGSGAAGVVRYPLKLQGGNPDLRRVSPFL